MPPVQPISAEFKGAPSGSVLAAVGIVIGSAAILFFGEAAVLIVAAGVTGIAALPIAGFLIAPYLALVMGFCVPVNEWPFTIGVQWYGADVMLVFIVAMLLAAVTRGGEAWRELTRGERWIVWMLLITAAYGVLSAIYGYKAGGYALNEVLGDFRRRYFYLLVLLAPLVLTLPRRTPSYLRLALTAATCIVLATGAYRVVTVQSWNPETHQEMTEAVKQNRYLSHTEVTTVCAGLALASAELRNRRRRLSRFFYAALATASAGMLLISGWRLALFLAVFVPAATFGMLTWMRKERFTTYLWSLVVGATLVAVGVAIFSAAFPEQVLKASGTMITRIQQFDMRDDMRYYAWREALLQIREHPLTGTGLGHQLQYFSRGVMGDFAFRESAAHNTFIDVTYQTGPLGLVSYLVLHALLLAVPIARLRELSPAWHGLAIGLLGGHVALFAFSLVQPLQVGAIITEYLLIGCLLWLVHNRSQESATSTAT